ncbi:MAG: hypothetical protein ACXW1W_14765 [Methylococcaceae bacterium]
MLNNKLLTKHIKARGINSMNGKKEKEKEKNKASSFVAHFQS